MQTPFPTPDRRSVGKRANTPSALQHPINRGDGEQGTGLRFFLHPCTGIGCYRKSGPSSKRSPTVSRQGVSLPRCGRPCQETRNVFVRDKYSKEICRCQTALFQRRKRLCALPAIPKAQSPLGIALPGSATVCPAHDDRIVASATQRTERDSVNTRQGSDNSTVPGNNTLSDPLFHTFRLAVAHPARGFCRHAAVAAITREPSLVLLTRRVLLLR